MAGKGDVLLPGDWGKSGSGSGSGSKYKAPAKKTGSGSKGSGSGSSSSSSSSSGGYTQKKTDDKPQVRALAKMLGDKGFKAALKIKLGNINRQFSGQNKMLIDDYRLKEKQLRGSRADNQKTMSGASALNLTNRARERQELMEQTASQGAGESDTLKVGMQALNNWNANQAGVNRDFYDTQRSINSEINDLNSSTCTARGNLYTQRDADRGNVWSNYYNQRTDAWTQMGNIQANPYSNAYKKNSKSFDNAAKETAKAYESTGIPKGIQEWKGTIGTTEQRINQPKTIYQMQRMGDQAPKKKPEGATLRKW